MSNKKVYIAADRESAGKVVEKLQSLGIQAFEKAEGSGEVMKVVTGVSFTGNAIYVPKEQFDEATEIIHAFVEEEGDALKPKAREYSKSTRIVAFAFAIIMLLTVIISFLSSIL